MYLKVRSTLRTRLADTSHRVSIATKPTSYHSSQTQQLPDLLNPLLCTLYSIRAYILSSSQYLLHDVHKSTTANLTPQYWSF